MDIRDITEPVVYEGIEGIFYHQAELLKGYTKIEKLPPWPIDINTRVGQDLIKDFISRIIEELGEGFESYVVMINLFRHGVPEAKMIPHLQNFNEEIADALHFWAETMLYSGYADAHMLRWLHQDVESASLPEDHLEAWLDYGKALVEQEIPTKAWAARMVIKDEDLDNEFLRGGRQLSSNHTKQMKQYLWDITYSLQMVRNTLKNKPWKQTEMMTDMGTYGGWMKKTCIALFKFLAFTGFTKEAVYEIYYKKNRVNVFRQKSKY